MINAGDAAPDGQRFLIGVGAEGETAWEQHDPSGVGRALAMAPDGGVLVCDDVGGYDHRVSRFAPDGRVAWSTIGAGFCGGLALTDSGVVVVGGVEEVLRFSLDGQTLPSWPIQAPGDVDDIAVNGDEVVLLGSGSPEVFWVGGMSGSGELRWVREVGTAAEPVGGIAVAVTRSGTVIVGGYVGLVQGGPAGVAIPTGLWIISADGELRRVIAGGFGEVAGKIDDVFALPNGGAMVTGGIRGADPDRLLLAEVADDGELLWLLSGDDALSGAHGFAVAVDSCGSAHVAGWRGALTGWSGRYNLPER